MKLTKSRDLKKEDIIGLILGIILVQAIGLSGFIPYVLGIIFGVWFTKKMLNKGNYAKIFFWVFFVLVIIALIYRMQEPQYYF